MKFITIKKPLAQEVYRIYEVMFYQMMQELDKITNDASQQLYALSLLADCQDSYLQLAASKLSEPLNKPTKMEIAVTLAYLNVPIRDIRDVIMHGRTYYNNVYKYFDENNTDKMFNRLEKQLLDEVIKLMLYLKKLNSVFNITKRSIVYEQ